MVWAPTLPHACSILISTDRYDIRRFFPSLAVVCFLICLGYWTAFPACPLLKDNCDTQVSQHLLSSDSHAVRPQLSNPDLQTQPAGESEPFRLNNVVLQIDTLPRTCSFFALLLFRQSPNWQRGFGPHRLPISFSPTLLQLHMLLQR